MPQTGAATIALTSQRRKYAMRKFPAILPCLLVVSMSLPACVMPTATSTGGSAAALGPDGVWGAQ